jgi:hypothetical protein
MALTTLVNSFALACITALNKMMAFEPLLLEVKKSMYFQKSLFKKNILKFTLKRKKVTL